jgi:Protein of unknown function (DUF2934)
MIEESLRMAETLDERIRECAYHMWEASGRPRGRDEEFWHRAREMMTTDDGRRPDPKRRQPRQAQPARPARRSGRRAPALVLSGTPAG